eukprot:TRINITY_DN13659_c0_g1_i2.p2 TRINITY_DN13659_c0_g1~~TRINITY_DN13659_c0_g1_i2.p2  ORF type:complete len:140 (-),score=33.99 TRINITY_DN13659_c0_g1_i2:122-541(-)
MKYKIIKKLKKKMNNNCLSVLFKVQQQVVIYQKYNINIDLIDHTLQTSLNNQQQQVINERSPTPQFNSYSEPQQPKELDYQKFDLNKLTTDELNKEKSKMDEVFLKNQKKPGESGFVYDIQKDFEPYEENEWDDEDEEW